MAGISAGGGKGGKKAVDHEIPLVPFIDLLLCCVMFLLVTAVWNQLARIDANQQQPGLPDQVDKPPEEKIELWLHLQATGYVLRSTAGDSVAIPKNGETYDIAELRTKLQERKRLEPDRTEIYVAPDDGIVYQDMIQAMDVAVGEGFHDVAIRDGGSAMM